jgi:hypothetical protein
MRVVSLRPQVPSPHHAARRCPARGAARRRAAGAAGAARACPVMYPAAGIARNATAAATCAQSTVRAPKSGGGREFPLSPTVTGNGWGSVGAARGWRLRGGRNLVHLSHPPHRGPPENLFRSARPPSARGKRPQPGAAGAAGRTSALKASSFRTCIASSVPMYHGETQLTRTPSCRRRAPQALRGAAPCGGAAGGAPWPTRTRGSL